jgi:hypothetical protein
MICYITFSVDITKQYAYACGSLEPRAGDLVVIEVGKDNHLKIVPCVRTSTDSDPLATKQIFGVVQLQPRPPLESL